MKVRTRFAPSPTGTLHLGGARTAIFNWLFARHHGGEFVLRVEDTDQARSTKESLSEILSSMNWLGLDWDGKPIKQSERLQTYQKYANMLLETGKAYRCYVTPEVLAERRKEAQKKGQFFQYNRKWASENEGPNKPYAIRLLTPDEGSVEVEDLIRGQINFDSKEIDDFIILRMDGYATYNFAVAIDDALMELTHIIRGDDHLSNTPKQMMIYKALELEIPKFAHVSMILGEDKSKLSKRHGATSVSAYKDMGYLPEAMVNYLARLGWSYGDEEIFSRMELINKFTLENVGKSPAVFNPEKLEWLNSHYIKEKPASEIAELLIPLFSEKGYKVEIDEKLIMIIEQLKDRAKTLNDFVEQSKYFFTDTIEFDEKVKNKFLNQENIPVFEALIEELSNLDQFNHDNINKAFEEVMNKTGLKLGKVAQPTRVALTGGTVSPGIFEVIEIMGKETATTRLQHALNTIKQ